MVKADGLNHTPGRCHAEIYWTYSYARGSRCTWKTADSDTVSTYQVSSVQVVTDKVIKITFLGLINNKCW